MIRFLPLFFCAVSVVSASLSAQELDCKVERFSEQPVTYSRELLPLVQGTIARQPVKLVLDTGSTITLLTKDVSIRLGLKLRLPTRGLKGLGAAVQSSMADAIYQAPGANDEAVELGVVSELPFDSDADGLVGARQIFTGIRDIDLSKQRLTSLATSGNCSSVQIGGAGTEELDLLPTPSADARLHIPIEVNGIRMKALIDSGSLWTTVFRPAAEKAGFNSSDPQAIRIGQSAGIERGALAAWSAPFNLKIGGKNFERAFLRVIDADPKKTIAQTDVLLGLDWLHAHRIVVVPQSRKLLISSVSTDVFRSTNASPEHWVLRLANDGNLNAGYVLGKYYATQRNMVAARTWFERTSAAGHPGASYFVGRGLASAGRFTAAIPHLMRSVTARPADAWPVLWLFLARSKGGDGILAKDELKRNARYLASVWPSPIVEYHLGRTNIAELKRIADKVPNGSCDVRQYVEELASETATFSCDAR